MVTPSKSDGAETPQEIKLCFLQKWNIIYMVKFYQNQRILILSHAIQFMMALIILTILYSVVNTNFKYGIYLSPLCIIYSSIQVILIKKSLTNPKYHWIFQLVSLVIFLPVFLGVYFYIYNPTFSQEFVEGAECKVIKDSKAILQDGSYQENFQVLTVEFTLDGKQYQGCGCGSDKYQETIFQTKIEPFRYITNDEMTALNIKTNLEQEDISQIKMPSWMCQPYQNFSANLKDPNNTSNKVGIQKCYYNFYGMRELDVPTQASQDYCKSSDHFVQIIFEEKPYFPVDQFCLLMAFAFMPLFSCSLNWILVIIIHYLFPCLRVEVEKGFFEFNRPQIIVPSSKVVPTNSKQKEQSKPIQSSNFEKKKINLSSNNNINNNKGILNSSMAQTQSKGQPNSPQDQNQTNRKDSQNNSQYIENNNYLNVVQNENMKLNSNTSIHYSYDIERYPKNADSQASQQTSITPKPNEIFFSLPSAKKKVLPPISVSVNFQAIMKENIKKEIEENKHSIENNLNTESPTLRGKKKLRYQSSIDLPDVITNSKSTLPSILQNKEKKGLNSSMSQKKKHKVQFVGKEDQESKINYPKKDDNIFK